MRSFRKPTTIRPKATIYCKFSPNRSSIRTRYFQSSFNEWAIRKASVRPILRRFGMRFNQILIKNPHLRLRPIHNLHLFFLLLLFVNLLERIKFLIFFFVKLLYFFSLLYLFIINIAVIIKIFGIINNAVFLNILIKTNAFTQFLIVISCFI